jgi:hypothetical protein
VLLAESYKGLLCADGDQARRFATQACREFPDEPAAYLQAAMALTVGYKTDDLFEVHQQKRGFREAIVNAQAGLARMRNTRYLLRSRRTDAYDAVRSCEGELRYWMAFGLLLQLHCEGIPRCQLRAMRDHIQRARSLLGEDHDKPHYHLYGLYDWVMSVEVEEAQIDGESAAEAGAEWYYSASGRVYGPLGWDDLKNAGRVGKLLKGDMIWSNGTGWICAASMIGLYDLSTID